MITHSHRILIGANGWLHPAWQTQFYPDDLPDDWQLGYYSNEFQIVLLPAAYWQSIAAEIEDWLEDSSDNLRIVCEVPAEMMQQSIDGAVKAINEFIEGLSVLGEHCIGLLLSIVDGQSGLDEIVSQLDSRFPLCLEAVSGASDETHKTIQKVCEQQKMGLCWHGDGIPAGLSYGQLAITKINSQGMDLRQLRHVVETILKGTTEEQTSILIIEGDPPDLEAIRHTGVILDLF